LLAAPDKLLHAFFSFLLASVDPALAILAGLLKEVYDFFGGGVADVLDLVADAVGILAAL
jgi:hypothetical protein